MTRPIITLTTDFGTADGYSAQMKGVILGINADVQLIDITHAVGPQDIERASDVLADVVDSFPRQTIHLVVVDPGVGTDRRIVAVETEQRRFVAPDNGVLSAALARDPLRRGVEIDRAAVPSRTVSNTFEGRDVMAPVAAYWSLGRDPVEFGRPLGEPLRTSAIRAPRILDDRVIGQIIRQDRFGNLITNIHESNLSDVDPGRLCLRIGARSIDRLETCYAARPPGMLLMLIGSSGRLEIAVNGGSAADQLDAGVGTEVELLLNRDANPS